MAETTSGSVARIDVNYVAHLARLALTPAETDAFQGQLDRIVEYINQLRQVDVAGVEPTAHATAVTNVFRADEVRPGLSRDTALANAPFSQAGQFMVPKIIE